ncbi:hypothetical protein P8452_59160 [Trifolium repens]|nr:hypothetical protein P8452_59160 [Trifolium repens]
MILKAETKDSWSWFIDLLLEDLNGFQYKKWSFISDQQKGLVPTIASTSDYVEHRLCVKHLSCKGKTTADRMIPKGGNKSNSNMTQPGPSATTARHAPTATISKGPASTKKRKNDDTAPNVITPSAATTPSGLRKSARIVTNTVDPIGTQQSTNKP